MLVLSVKIFLKNMRKCRGPWLD